ncbi:hypothetical protein CHS0354_034558 [Potamilus streckersoni]|uniref:Uncharacterized protein n=1 Tax=Potamilus streckersoni TaxID=2493646 RepID=A0AAE0SV88_9BIVA|nr:hypothetical protein CHS0354_034558 [Potamilus streckersoni]
MMYQVYSTETMVVEKKPAAKKMFIYALVLLTVVLGIGIGIAIGRLAICSHEKRELKPDGVLLPGISEALIKDGDPTIGDDLIQAIKSENIAEYLRNLTNEPHLAGTSADKRQAEELRDFWLHVGLDHVTITPYKVLLSYPNNTEPNFVQLLDNNQTILYNSPLNETIIRPEENKTDVVPPFNAYSAPGDEYVRITLVLFIVIYIHL